MADGWTWDVRKRRVVDDHRIFGLNRSMELLFIEIGKTRRAGVAGQERVEFKFRRVKLELLCDIKVKC